MEEPLFSSPDEIPFSEVLTALLDQDHVLDPLYLYRLSDLSPQNLAELTKIWKDIQVERRRALIEDLEILTESNTLLSFEPLFRFALTDDDEQVRFFTTRAIEEFDTDDLIPFFLSVLDQEESVNVRAVTASVLGKYVYRGELDKISAKTKKKIEDKLLDILDSAEPEEIRQRALEAVSFSSREEVRSHILDAYHSGQEDWIASAIFAMGRSLDTEYGELVCDRLEHKSPKVRLEAVRASGELSLEDAVPYILDMLYDLPEIREAAIWALSLIGGEDAGPALQGLLDDKISDEESDLIQQALERLEFTEDGVDMSIFDIPYREEKKYLLDDYDYEQDDFDDDDFDYEDDDDYGYDDDLDDDFDDEDDYDDDDEDDLDLDEFDVDDDYWME
jgi:HEAT repeat protein